MAADSSSSPARPAGWPPLLTLVVLAIVAAGWLHYRDPTVFPRTLRAARALTERPLRLPWDPELLPDAPARELDRPGVPLPPPRTIHQARAERELERPKSRADTDDQTLTPAERRKRYDDWLRSQGLERLQGR